MMHLVTFTALSEFPDRLRAHFSALPEEAQVRATQERLPEEEGAFDVLLAACTREVARYQTAIARAVKEDAPTVPEDEPAAAPSDDPAEEVTVDTLLHDFVAARKHTLSLLAGLSDAQWSREVILGDDGRTSLVGVAHLLCRDDFACLSKLQQVQAELRAA